MKNKLPPEQMKKCKDCKTTEEAKKLTEKENVKLPDEQLEAVAGGLLPGIRGHNGKMIY